MPPQATPSAESRAAGHADAWRTLGRHQIGALVGTAIDFGSMIACVEEFGMPPVAGTAIGATFGGVANFVLGRSWIFRHQSGSVPAQAIRYALVSAAGAAWNALGEHLVADRAHVQYVLARAIVAVLVSLFWNFPMQRQFVFHEGRAR
jgi:putative flippase GtrA